jgi:hypothetical protein
MSCLACVHGVGLRVDVRQYDTAGNMLPHDMNCSLNPTWVKVRSDHFCSHMFSLSDFPKRKEEDAQYRRENNRHMGRLEERARDAERKLKKANARIKALRGKPDAG